jgi:amino acid transporter
MALTHRGLSQRSVGAADLMTLGISASCPMAVLAGAVVTTFAVTGVVAIPPSFIALAAVLALFAVGYLAISREVTNAATFYAFLARSLGPAAGVAGAAISLLSYNAVQVSLYGLIGAVMSGVIGGAWWIWAFVAWLVVGALGVLHIGANIRVLGVILVLEIAVILLLDSTGLLNPAGGQVDAAPLLPSSLLTSGSLGGVLAFGIASFIGIESIAVYREEAVGHRSVVIACYGTIGFLGLFYALSSWALAAAVGTDKIVDTSRDPGANLPFSVLGEQYGQIVGTLGQTLLVTGLFAALLSFHQVVARYVYSLAREGVLPANLGALGGTQGSVPIAGSAVQTLVGALGLAAFAVAGADPIAALFTWLSELSALGILVLMILTSIGVVRYFSVRGGGLDFQRGVAPACSAFALTAVLIISIVNMDSITPDAATLRWILPGLVLLVGVAGVVVARRLRARSPVVYAGIGQGEPLALAVPEPLADLEL